jgi:hypothetical protein
MWAGAVALAVISVYALRIKVPQRSWGKPATAAPATGAD